MNRTLFILSLVVISFHSSISQTDLLQECVNKQAKPADGKYLQCSYTETLSLLYHSPEPWQQLNYEGKGTIWFNSNTFLKQDTLTLGSSSLYSKTQYNGSELLLLDHGDKEMSPVTEKMFSERVLLSLRYTPAHLLNFALQQKFILNKRLNLRHAVYEGTINKTQIKFYIRKSDSLLERINILRDDELYGDLSEMYFFSDYSKGGGIVYPKTIAISKHNGKLKDEIKITSSVLTASVPSLLQKPNNYTIKQEELENSQVNIEKYSDHIYFINMLHASSRVLLVEFSDFFLVAEAPLNSKNGERIISEAKKIAPDKPIKYFVFGHHHPHYLGGLRAFVHKGTTILTQERNKDYLYYLTNVPHTISPDSLSLQSKQLQLEIVKDSTIITDGKYTMKIYFMGDKSGHTKDYMVYYFPNEKMLFEDDLVWIPSKGEPKKASERQIGIYNLIKEKNLNVKTIIQSWGIASTEYKTKIPFKDLEASVNMK